MSISESYYAGCNAMDEVIPVVGRNHVPIIVKTNHIISTRVGIIRILIVNQCVSLLDVEVTRSRPDWRRAVIADNRALLDEGSLHSHHGQRGDAAAT